MNAETFFKNSSGHQGTVVQTIEVARPDRRRSMYLSDILCIDAFAFNGRRHSAAVSSKPVRGMSDEVQEMDHVLYL